MAQKAAPKRPEWPSYGNFPKVTQNPHFLKKCEGGPIQIYENSPKKDALALKAQKHSRPNHIKNRLESSLRLKFSKALWRKQHYPLISMHLKCKDWTRFGCRHRLQKCPNGQVITIFARSLKTRIFLKRAKGGPIEIFQKSPKKMPSP